MSESIYPQQFVAHFDEDGIDLVSSTHGPAGVAELELTNGISLLIDFADPDSLTSLRVEGQTIPDTLVELIGEERAELLASAERNPAAKPLRLLQEESNGDEEFSRFRGSQPRPPLQLAQELGVLSRLKSLSEDEEVHDVVRATSALEFARNSRRFNSELPGFLKGNPGATAEVAELLDGEEASLGRVSGSAPKAAAQLAGLLRRYQSENETLRRAYEVLTGPIAGGFQDHELRHAVASIASLASSDHRLAEFDFDAPIRISAVSISNGGLLKAHVTLYEDNWWLRVTLEGSQVLLAVVPVVERGDRAVAEAILPPDVSLNDVDLLLTQTPLPESTSSIDQVINAIDLGRKAVRRSLVEQFTDTAETWMQCADAWEVLGDVQRAKQARTYAARGLRSAGPHLITAEVLAVFESA